MDKNVSAAIEFDPVGVIPAAGEATRISPLPCSKELFPIGFCDTQSEQGNRPMASCEYLLAGLKAAGVTETHIIIRSGKWDIPEFLKSGGSLGMHFSYLMMDLPYGVAYTVDGAYPFTRHRPVVFGFPDIIFEPSNALAQLVRHFRTTPSDIVLGLFLATHPEKMDMVALNNNQVSSIVIKPSHTSLRYTWIFAVWGPRFTNFLHSQVAAHHTSLLETAITPWGKRPELHLGQIIQEALVAGLAVDNLIFDQGTYIDIGTPEDLKRALHHYIAAK